MKSKSPRIDPPVRLISEGGVGFWPIVLVILWALLVLVWLSSTAVAQVLLDEDFNDPISAPFYDNLGLVITPGADEDGSGAARFHFAAGASLPDSGPASRVQFTPSNEIWISYRIRFEPGWTGSNLSVHPHFGYVLSTASTRWQAPAFSRITAYFEDNEGVPMLALQDGQNVDTANVKVDLTLVTESRALQGCNGAPDAHGVGDCYARTGTGQWWNGRFFRADSPVFVPGPWYDVEVMYRLNTISADGIGIADGAMAMFVDGVAVIDVRDVMMRTGANPTIQWNQALIAPYLSRSPVEQAFLLGHFNISTARLDTPEPIAECPEPIVCPPQTVCPIVTCPPATTCDVCIEPVICPEPPPVVVCPVCPRLPRFPWLPLPRTTPTPRTPRLEWLR